MTPADILRMAREAGLPFYDSALSDQSPVERFAALVAAEAATDYGEGFEEGYKAGAAAEQEACAKVAEEAKVTSEQEPLARFYGVTSKDELIAALEQHILRVQAKLPPLRDEQPRKIREG